MYGSNPRPCALGFVSPGFDRVSRPPLLTVRGGGTRPILESNGGSIRSYGHYEGRGSAWYDYQAMPEDDVPLHTLSLPS